MVQIYKKFILLLIALCIAAAGCAPAEPPRDCLEYQKDAASMIISGSISMLDFSARLTLAACDELAERDFKLEYTAPDALCGIIIRREGGVFAAELDGISVSGEAARRLSLPTHAFAVSGEILSHSAENGITRLKLQNAEITIENDAPSSITLLLDDGRTLRLKIDEYLKEGKAP
jgi:hypothetical protein